MKDIRKLFNIKKSSKTSLFSFSELVMICLTFSAICCFLTGFVIIRLTNISYIKDSAQNDILSTYNKIKENYYEKVDSNEIADAAIDGMLSYLNEKYSVYMDSEDTSSLQDKLKGNYSGLGIGIIKDSEGNTVISEVYDNTPASASGIKREDIIVEINGLKVNKDVTNEEVVKAIKDEDEANIVVLRNNEEHIFRIKKSIVDYPVTTTKTFKKNNKNIGYIHLSTFSSSSEKQVRSSLKRLEDEGIDSLVFDLRANSGGYLTSATTIANMFLRKGDIIYSLEDKDTKEEVRDTSKERREYDIVVLIDSNTASASELLAASLHDSYGAILVGHTSYGKGKVQEMSTLSDETMIKFTTAKWFTPLGDSIDTIGITPDITVDLTEKYAKNPTDENDEQLQMALYVLANK